MTYAMTLSSQGQITLPKSLRDAIGLKLKEKIRISQTADGQVVLEREPGLKERMDAFYTWVEAQMTPEMRAAREENKGKTVHQMMDEYWASPKGQAELDHIATGEPIKWQG